MRKWCQHSNSTWNFFQIFNCDEVAVFLNPKSPKNGKRGGKILAGRGDRTIYTVSGNGENECVTVLVAANAAGMKAPPMIVYKYERIPEEVARSVPKEWGIGRSPKSGWMFS